MSSRDLPAWKSRSHHGLLRCSWEPFLRGLKLCFKMCFIGYLICLRRSPLGTLRANVDFPELSCLCDNRRRDHHGPVATPRSISPVRYLLKCKVTCKLTSYTPLKSIFLRHFYRFPKQPVCFFRHLNISIKVANCPLVSHL